jgi:hypothetical protein
MNLAVGTRQNGTKFLLMILEPGNIHRLQQGDPISTRIEDLFPGGIPKRLQLVISYRETPEADARALSKMADVSLDERTPVAKAIRPHCPECRSTIEQVGLCQNDSPVDFLFCSQCGCTLGVITKRKVESCEAETKAER